MKVHISITKKQLIEKWSKDFTRYFSKDVLMAFFGHEKMLNISYH
jgi:hypothetical protein